MFVIFLLLWGMGHSAVGEETDQAAATVVAIRGDVKAISAKGQERSLSIKSLIYAQETIKTGRQGRYRNRHAIQGASRHRGTLQPVKGKW